MPPIKLEVISHDVQRGRASNEYNTQSWDFDSHTMRAKLSVLPEQVRSYGPALHCIMMLLYIPYLVDAMHVIRVHGVDYSRSTGNNDIFHKRHISNPGLVSSVIGFILIISLLFAIDLLRSIFHVFCDAMKYVDKVYEYPYTCSIVGTPFPQSPFPQPKIDFANLEVTFHGTFLHNFDHPDEPFARMHNEDPDNARKFEPGEEFEIDFSPVQYMCLFKQANKPAVV